MEQMLLVSSLSMTRKVLTLLVVLVVSGLVPATAAIGFCANMPCCAGEAKGLPALDVKTADCCSTISCDEPPPKDLTVSPKLKFFTAATPATLLVAGVVAPISRPLHPYHPSAPPPTTSERLSSLSSFLI